MIYLICLTQNAEPIIALLKVLQRQSVAFLGQTGDSLTFV